MSSFNFEFRVRKLQSGDAASIFEFRDRCRGGSGCSIWGYGGGHRCEGGGGQRHTHEGESAMEASKSGAARAAPGLYVAPPLIGGIGGGGIFVPMLALVIGFDTKSATAVSKCMVMATAGVTSYFNLRKQHPTLVDHPLIDYDLTLLIQPVLVLGISIGVTLNIILPQWIVTILLIGLVLVTSTRAYRRGVEVWNNENMAMANGNAMYVALPGTPRDEEVRLLMNVRWKEVCILVSVWLAILGIQIAKNDSTTCSVAYWALNLLQIPVNLGASLYEAVMLYKGSQEIASRGEQAVGSNPTWELRGLAICCVGALLAGTAGGMLGLGGGFVLSPFLLEMGIPQKVTGATAMFAITFSSSMSVVEYYLLHRFPVLYALYFFGVAILATLVGQLVVTKLIEMVGRESIILFVLAFTIFISAVLLGTSGIIDAVYKIENKEYMGLENLCSY